MLITFIFFFFCNLNTYKCQFLFEYYNWMGYRSLNHYSWGLEMCSCTDQLSWVGSAYQEYFQGCTYYINLDKDLQTLNFTRTISYKNCQGTSLTYTFLVSVLDFKQQTVQGNIQWPDAYYYTVNQFVKAIQTDNNIVYQASTGNQYTIYLTRSYLRSLVNRNIYEYTQDPPSIIANEVSNSALLTIFQYDNVNQRYYTVIDTQTSGYYNVQIFFKQITQPNVYFRVRIVYSILVLDCQARIKLDQTRYIKANDYETSTDYLLVHQINDINIMNNFYVWYADANSYPCPILDYQVILQNNTSDWIYDSASPGSIKLRLSSSILYGPQSFQISIKYSTLYSTYVTNYLTYNVYCQSDANPQFYQWNSYKNYNVDLVAEQNQFVNIVGTSGDVGWVFNKLNVPYHDQCGLTYQVYQNQNLTKQNRVLKRYSFFYDEAQKMTNGSYIVKLNLDKQLTLGTYTFYLLIIAQNSQGTITGSSATIKDSWWSSYRYISDTQNSTQSYTLTLIDCSSQSQFIVIQNQVISNIQSVPDQGFLIQITPPVGCDVKLISSQSAMKTGDRVLNDFNFNQQLNQYYSFPIDPNFTGKLSVYLLVYYNQGGSTISKKAYNLIVTTQAIKDYLENNGQNTPELQYFFLNCLPLINSLNPQALVNFTADQFLPIYYSNTDIQNQIQQLINIKNLNNQSLPELIIFEEFQPKDYTSSCGTGVYTIQVAYKDKILKSDDPLLQKLVVGGTQALYQKDLEEKISQIGILRFEFQQQLFQLDQNKKYNFLYLQPQLINNLSSNQFRLQISFFKQSDLGQLYSFSQKTFFYDFIIQYFVPFVMNNAPLFIDQDGKEVNSSQVINFEATDNNLISPYSLGAPIDQDNNNFSIYIKEDVKQYVKLQTFSNTLIFSKLTQQLKSDLQFTVVIKDNALFPKENEYKFLIKVQRLEKHPLINVSNDTSNSSNTFDNINSKKQEELKPQEIIDDFKGPSPKLLVSPMTQLGKIVFKFTRPVQIPDQLIQLQEQDITSLSQKKDARNLQKRSQFYTSKLITKTNQSHSLYITQAIQTQIDFQAIFDHPELISMTDQSSCDVLQIILSQDLLTYLVDLNNGQPVDFSFFGKDPVIKIKIPPQIDSLNTNAQLSSVKTLSDALKVVTIGSFILQYFLSFSMNFFWSLIHSLSMVVFLPLFNINLPVNFQNVINFLANIAFFDIVPYIDDINEAIFQFSEKSLVPVRFQSVGFGLLGFASQNFIMNSGSQFLMFCIFVCSIIISAFLKFLAKRSRKFQWLYQKTNFFDDPKTVFLRFLFEGNLLLMISAIIGVELIPQVVNMTNNVGDLLAVVFSVIFIFLTIPFIIFVEYIITRKIQLLEKTFISDCEKYYKNIEEINQLSEEQQKQFWIYVDWKSKLKRIDQDFDIFFEGIKSDDNISLQFYYIYLLRRLILVVTIFYLENYLSLQIIVNICVNLAIIAYYAYFMPFKTKLLNIIEIFNEICVLFVTYSLCFYTDWINDSNLKIKLSDISIYIIYTGSAFNLFLIFIEIIKALQKKIKQMITIKKYSQQLQKLSTTFKIREKYFLEQSNKTGKTVQQLRKDWEIQRETFMVNFIALHLKSIEETRLEAIFEKPQKIKKERQNDNQGNQIANDNFHEEPGNFEERNYFKVIFKEQTQKNQTNISNIQNFQNKVKIKKLDDSQVKAIRQNKLKKKIDLVRHKDSNQTEKIILANQGDVDIQSPGEKMKKARQEIINRYSQQKKKRQQEMIQRLIN